MSNKRKFKFKFRSVTTSQRCTGDGFAFADSLEQAMAEATAGIRRDIGPTAVVTSIREVRK